MRIHYYRHMIYIYIYISVSEYVCVSVCVCVCADTHHWKQTIGHESWWQTLAQIIDYRSLRRRKPQAFSGRPSIESHSDKTRVDKLLNLFKMQ